MRRLALPLLFAAFAAQALWAIADKAPTADEFAHHVANGYSYLVTGDFKMNPASPPLPRMLSALPLLLTGVKAPLDHPSWRKMDSPAFAREFFYRGGVDADLLLILARIPILLLSLFLAWFVMRWANEWFGPQGALAALILYAFCPDLIAHSSLATADLAVACFFAMCLRHFADFLEEPSVRRAVYCGVAAGLAMASKFTGLLLPILLPAIALFSGRVRTLTPRRSAAFVLAAFLSLWSCYFFEMKPLLDRTPDPAKKEAVYQAVGGERLLSFARHQKVPLATFASAVASMVHTRAVGTRAFLMGEWSRQGWPHYYFVAFFVKNTLPFVLLFLIGIVFLPRFGLSRIRMTVILLPIVIFFVLTMRDRAQAGIRYFLPVYPLVILLGARAARAGISSKRRVMTGAVVLLLVWHAVSALSVCPNDLAYFNDAAGGPKVGYRWLRDSNLDWGQDLKPLATQIRQRGYEEVVLYYPWPADPDYYKIPHRDLMPEEMEHPGPYVYVIPAHFLENAAWTSGVKPTFTVGYSIFVYDLRKQ